MKLRNWSWLMGCLAIVGMLGCEKIIAEDITQEMPVLIFPIANDTVEQNPVLFKWEEIEGATRYRLEIVSPSFANPSAFVLDSLISGTQFSFALDSNEYELRLMATNGAYDSQILGPVKFWVGVQPSGTSGQVIITAPADDAYVNDAAPITFQWMPISGTAVTYEFSLRTGSTFQTGSPIHTATNISSASLTYGTSIAEGTYSWGVKAFADGSETPYSIRTLYVDLTDPNTAQLLSPNDFGSGISTNVTFTWGNGTDGGTVQSPITSVFEIATDAGFGTPTATNVQGTSLTLNLTSGTYFWRVRNIDAAGNAAGYSAVRQYTVF